MVVRWPSLSTHLMAVAVTLIAGFSPLLESTLRAQDAAAAPGGAGGQASGRTETSRPVSSERGRRLAPDAIHIIPPSPEYGETFEGPLDLPLATPASELEWGPPKFPEHRPHFAPASETLLAMTKGVIFRREIWAMEIGFKPVRMIPVDIRNKDGETETKLVWYLLYYVKYRGGDLKPNPTKDQVGTEFFAQPQTVAGRSVRRFMPGFVLNSTALGKRYQSQFIPEALAPIAEKERVGKPIYDAIAIEKVPVQLSTSRESHEVWGVATWTDIDPRTDFFTVEIRGLTNAQRSKISDDGELISEQKTLVLNFWRPGDTINELEDRIRYGVPAISDEKEQKAILHKYGLQERLDHYWVYR
ncbi:MAG: hypothetical protein ACTHK7_00290 [Aureliella sp.]